MKSVGRAAVRSFERGYADRIGAWLSSSCAAHCMAVPLLSMFFPLLGLPRFVGHPVESGLLIVSVGLAVGSLCWGFQVHRKGRVLLVLGAALGLIATGRLWVEESGEILLVTTGAMTLALGHLLNRYLCRMCVPCEHGEHLEALEAATPMSDGHRVEAERP